MSKTTKTLTITLVAMLLVVFVLSVFSLVKPKPKSQGAVYTQNTTGGPSGHQTMAQATTTVCAIQSPNATTTLAFFSANFTTSSTTASLITMASANNAFATTTTLGVSVSIPANGQATIIATTTPGTIYAPLTWFVVGMAGGTGNFSPVGACNAQFNSVN